MMVEAEQLWAYLAASPLSHLTLTVVAFLLASRLFHLFRENPLFNPVPVAIIIIIAVLQLSDTDYWTYFDGARFVHFLLGPATVALAVPLYKHISHLKRAWTGILLSLTGGALIAIISVVVIAAALGASETTLISLSPKSITTPVAMGLSEKLGGIPSLTAVLVIFTGILGASCGSRILAAARVTDPAAMGFAFGIAAHGIGTARAFQISETAGAYAGLAMALNALLTCLLLPALVYLSS